MLFLDVQGDINTFIGKIVNILKILYNIILVAIPIIMLILGTIDLLKAVTSGDEKDVKTATSLLGKRMLYGVGAFFVLLIVQTVIIMVDGDTDWSLFWGSNSSENTPDENTPDENKPDENIPDENIPDGNETQLSVTCPAEIKYFDIVGIIVGDIKANKDFTECDVPEGYEFIRIDGSSGELKRNKPGSNSDLIIKIKDSDGNSAECRIKMK